MKNKNIFKIIIFISAILFLSVELSSKVRAQDIKKGAVSSDNGLNVRAEAKLKSKIISVLQPNSVVELLEESGDWYKIKIGSIFGYIHKEFVKLDSEGEDTAAAANSLSGDSSKTGVTEESKTIEGTVLTEKGLNLREEADAASKVIELLEPNTKVEVLETANIWCKVKANEHTGYVSKQYLKLDKAETQTVQASTNTAETKNEMVKGIVLTDNGLNLRSEANLKSKIVSIIKPKTSVNIIGESGDWYKLKIDTLEGYAFKQFIKTE